MQANNNIAVRYPHDVTKLRLWQRKKLFAKVCNNKEQFFSQRSCENRIEKIEARGLGGGLKLTAYICPFCGAWHYGHRPWDVDNK